MTRSFLTKEVGAYICDICGEELSDEEYEEGRKNQLATHADEGTGKIDSTALEAPVLRFLWPPSKKTARLQREIDQATAASEPEVFRGRNYDLHSKCVARLLDAAVRLRQQEDEKNRRDAKEEERRQQRIVAEHDAKERARKDRANAARRTSRQEAGS